ncbi:hypothetical protein ACHAWF_018348 [Thalassiosira exigua]
MSFASLTLSRSRRQLFRIRCDHYTPCGRAGRSSISTNDVAFAAVAPPPSWASLHRGYQTRILCSIFVGDCGAEGKIPCISSALAAQRRSLPPSAFSLCRWQSSTSSKSKPGTGPKRGKFLNVKDCQSVKAAADLAFERLDELSSANLSSFWTRISQLLAGPRNQRNRREREDLSAAKQSQLRNELSAIFNKTLDTMREFDQRHLTQLALALAKIVREVDSPQRRIQESTGQILHNILMGQNSKRKDILFQSIGFCALPLLPKFNARCLSNLAYANAIVGTVPSLKDGRSLFDHVAERSVPLLKTFKPQDLSNMVWAYEKVGASNPALFEEVAKEIVARDHLGTFKPQELSNILLAYSKSGVQSSELYHKVANHIVGLHDLGEFEPQHCSNMLWTFAKAGESNPRLFQKMADHIIGSNHLNSFNSQNLSNTVWAFAKAEESNPRLFQKVANHISGLNHLNSFNSQDLSNTTWAFAKAGESSPRLFQRVAGHIIGSTDLNTFNPQELTNTVWAFATAGESHPQLFHRVADHILLLDNLRSFSSKAASQLLWAYSSAGIVHTALFKKVHDHVEANVEYASLDEDDQSALLRAYQKAEHESTKKE